MMGFKESHSVFFGARFVTVIDNSNENILSEYTGKVDIENRIVYITKVKPKPRTGKRQITRIISRQEMISSGLQLIYEDDNQD